MADTVAWLTYDFLVYEYSTTWNAVAGIYIFCGINQQGLWFPLYVGQAKSFAERVPGHERWREAVRLGATHIHARVVEQQATRDQIEAALIRAYQPALNDQLK